MPTMTLLPNATILNIGWVVNTGTAHNALDDDNGDTSFVTTTTNGARLILGFADPTVAEGDIDFSAGISIRFTSSGRCPSRGSGGSDVDIRFQTPLGFAETINYFNNASYETENGTARTTKPDSSAWSYSDLEDLEMSFFKNGTADVRLSYLALEVTYTEAVVVTDNATFFGANF